MTPSAAGAARNAEVEAFFDRFSEAVFRLGRRITGNETDGEEVRQETFLKLQEHLPQLELGGNLAGWIFRTATTVALKIRKRRLVHLPSGEDVVAPAEPSPLADGFPVDPGRVSDALGRLEDPDRRLILVRFRDGLPPSQIARRMGLSPGAVRVRLFRAMELLREALRKST